MSCIAGDYGCYLKTDGGEDVLRAQALLLKVFVLIGGRQCSEYINALTASIMLWGHYEAVNHPCWQLFKPSKTRARSTRRQVRLLCLCWRGTLRAEACAMT